MLRRLGKNSVPRTKSRSPPTKCQFIFSSFLPPIIRGRINTIRTRNTRILPRVTQVLVKSRSDNVFNTVIPRGACNVTIRRPLTDVRTINVGTVGTIPRVFLTVRSRTIIKMRIRMRVLLIRPPLPMRRRTNVIRVLIVNMIKTSMMAQRKTYVSNRGDPSILSSLRTIRSILLRLGTRRERVIQTSIGTLRIMSHSLRKMNNMNILNKTMFTTRLRHTIKTSIMPIFENMITPLVPRPIIRYFLLFITRLNREKYVQTLYEVKHFLHFQTKKELYHTSSTNKGTRTRHRRRTRGDHYFSPFRLTFLLSYFSLRDIFPTIGRLEGEPVSTSRKYQA